MDAIIHVPAISRHDKDGKKNKHTNNVMVQLHHAKYNVHISETYNKKLRIYRNAFSSVVVAVDFSISMRMSGRMRRSRTSLYWEEGSQSHRKMHMMPERKEWSRAYIDPIWDII